MNRQPVWKRFLTVLAGPVMNVALAFAAGVVYFLMLQAHVYPQIDALVEGASAQLQPGDVIVAANGEAISYDDAGTEALRAIIQRDDTVALTVRRGEEMVDVTVVPATVVVDEATGETVKQVGMLFRTSGFAFGEAVELSGRLMRAMSTMLYDVLKDLIFHGQGADQITGVVGTVAVANQVLQQDASMAPYFVAAVSLNLGHRQPAAASGARRGTAGVSHRGGDPPQARAAGEGGHGARRWTAAVFRPRHRGGVARYRDIRALSIQEEACA